MNKWKTTVSELLKIFQGALISITPWLSKAKIGWLEGEAYDDWDNISIAIYENVVCCTLYGEILHHYSIAKYGFQYEDYSGVDYIKVKSKIHSDKELVFVSFQSNESPADYVKVAVIDNACKLIDSLSLESSNLTYLFVKNSGAKKVLIERVEAVL